ncbi:unnamed protein product [Trifolium pratense]|uniref:Uncharacterized protein n=1 Tax=Trifolium pratense TaxID=57577 RepID=A0ACB0LWR8_TRIPR|nr:unnamed protein product [Trifolium pratense]
MDDIDVDMDNESTQNEIVGVNGDGSQPPIEDIPSVDPASLPPRQTKKRKPNANGPRKTSPAWESFTKLPETECPEATAACNYCGKRYLCDPKSHGTTNMLVHSKICPKNPQILSNDPSQTVLTLGHTLGAASHRFNAEACKTAISKFIILDEQPFRVVEGEGFKQLIRTLQPQYTIPSRYTVSRDCFKLYLEEKARLRALFRSDCSRVALTTDCWTSVQNLGYLVLTAHYIDNEWNYVKKIINFSVVPNHRGDTIGKQVEECLKKWGLRNVSTITVDNASSNDVAVGVLKRRINNMNGLVLDGEQLHFRCCSHILNLVVNDGLKTNELAISKIRTAVRFVRSSPQRLAKFKECVGFAGITCRKSLCLDVTTRWNSTYLMLESAEPFQVAFDKLDIEDPSYLEYFGAGSCPPNFDDWDKARAFMKFLKIFYDATKFFSTSTHVSIHAAFHHLFKINNELKLAIRDSDPVLSAMGKDMKLKYEKYWGNVLNMNDLIYFGVILDPCFKMRFFEYILPRMYNDQPELAEAVLTKVKTNLVKMFNWYASAHDHQNRSRPFSSGSSVLSMAGSSVSAEQLNVVRPQSGFKSYLKEMNSSVRKTELEKYLDAPNVDEEGDFDVLLWWKQNCLTYPLVSVMARDVFATPVSTVASESAFSTGGRVIDSFRSCLSPEMAEALICTQNWLLPSIKQFKDQISQEDLDASEKIVRELCESLASTSVGAAGPSTPAPDPFAAGPSSQSRPFGRD